MVALSYTHKYISFSLPIQPRTFILSFSSGSSPSSSTSSSLGFFYSSFASVYSFLLLGVVILFYQTHTIWMQCRMYITSFFSVYLLSFSVRFGFRYGLFCFRFFPVFIFSFNDYILWFVIHSETDDSHNNKNFANEKKEEKKNTTNTEQNTAKICSFPISWFAFIRSL